MAHERIEVDLPLSKVYELLSNPVLFPNFMGRIDEVVKVNSQTFEFKTKIGNEEFQWTSNVIDNLRNTRFAWITINGNLNQTGTLRFTPLDNGERTRVDFSLDYRTFYGEPSEELQEFIDGLEEQMENDLASFKEQAEAGTFKDAGEEEEAKAETSEEEEVTA
ncbi:MAG: SRPBCC family protein [Bacteroidota bacterium]|jgi:uncharacterized membrane protein